MLAVLEKEPAAARGILAAAALAEPDQENSGYEEQVIQLLREVRAILKIDERDSSPRAQKLIDEAIARAIDAAIGDDADIATAAERAGRHGLLSPGAYQVGVSKRFIQKFAEWGVREKHVKEAVSRPDEFQHLLNDDPVEADLFSLFLKKFPGSRPSDLPHWLLVQTLRQGMRQEVQAAWWVYPTDVDLSAARSPLDVLRAFVEQYGVEVRVGQGQGGKVLATGKLIESVPVEKRLDAHFEYHFSVPAKPRDHFMSWSQQQTNDPDYASVGLAYCIDGAAYAQALAKHR